MTSGRPTELTPALAQEICARVAFGQTLARICRDPRMPWEPDLRRWLEDDFAFAQQYDAALRSYADSQFDQLQQLADEASPGNLNVNRFRAEVMKWRLARLDPARFGDRAEIGVTQRESTAPAVVRIIRHIITPDDHPRLEMEDEGEVLDAEVAPVAPDAAATPPEPPPPAPSATSGINRDALRQILPRRKPRCFF